MWVVLVKEEDNTVKVPLRSQERPLSFLGGHFQDTQESMNITRQVRELISSLGPH